MWISIDRGPRSWSAYCVEGLPGDANLGLCLTDSPHVGVQEEYVCFDHLDPGVVRAGALSHNVEQCLSLPLVVSVWLLLDVLNLVGPELMGEFHNFPRPIGAAIISDHESVHVSHGIGDRLRDDVRFVLGPHDAYDVHFWFLRCRVSRSSSCRLVPGEIFSTQLCVAQTPARKPIA